MNHQQVADNLAAYLDGRLDARQRARIERHLAECSACRAELAELRQTVSLLKQLPLLPVPRNFTLPASAQAQRRSFVRWNAAFGALRGATVAVALALFLFASGDLLFSVGVLRQGREAPSPQAMMAPQAASEVEPTAPAAAPLAVELAEQAEPAFGALAATAPEEAVAEAEQPQMLAKAAPVEQTDQVALAAEAEQPELSAEPLPEQASAANNSAPPLPRTVGARPATPEPQTRAMGATAEQPAVAEGQGGGGPAPTVELPTAPPPTAAPSPTLLPDPTATPEAQPERVAALVTPAPQEPTPAAAPLATSAEQPGWQLWRTVRYGAGLSLGLLVALCGLLLYAQRQRRV